MENAVAIQRLESRGFDTSILLDGMFGDPAMNVALVNPDDDQAIQFAAYEVMRRQRTQDEQSTLSLAVGETDYSASQFAWAMQSIPPDQLRVLAAEIRYGSEVEAEFARQKLGLPPEPKPNFEDDETPVERFHRFVEASEIVLATTKHRPHKGWIELAAIPWIAFSEQKEFSVEGPTFERSHSISHLRLFSAHVDPVPEAPRPSVSVREAATLENDE
jgi:hypothetical protein